MRKPGLAKAISASVLSAVLGLVLLGSAAVSASGGDFEDEEAQFRAFYNEWGVSSQVQDGLVELLENGELLDSMRAGEPSSSELLDDGDSLVRIDTYPDGSILVLEVEKPDEDLPPSSGVGPLANSLTGCSVSSGGGWASYSNCLVKANTGTMVIQFRVSYEKYAGANAKLLSSHSGSSSAAYGTITLPKRSLWRPNSTAVQKATVKYHAKFKSWNGAASEDIYLGFWLSANGTWSITNS